MKIDRDFKYGSITIEGYYPFKEIYLSCKKSKLEDVQKLLIQVAKVMKRLFSNFIYTEVFFVRTKTEDECFFVKFKETITIIG